MRGALREVTEDKTNCFFDSFPLPNVAGMRSYLHLITLLIRKYIRIARHSKCSSSPLQINRGHETC